MSRIVTGRAWCAAHVWMIPDYGRAYHAPVMVKRRTLRLKR